MSQYPILQTKLYIPPIRPGLVSRPRLIERLNGGLWRNGIQKGAAFAHRLTLISAPAGFGKTTLVSEWVQHGLRNTRYVGQSKRQFQRLWLGAAVNLKRLFTLAQAQKVDLHMMLSHLGPPDAGLMTT